MRHARAPLWLGLCLLAASGCVAGSSPSSPLQALEHSLIYHPAAYPRGRWPDQSRYEDVWFEASDGVRLHGWFAEAPNPRAVVLHCHGNAGNVSGLDWLVPLYRDYLRTSILVFDYRGYGKSEGKPSEAGILADARAARRWLAQRTGLRETDIVLSGSSLGGGVAVDLAAHDGARGLILENTYTSMPELAATKSLFRPLVPLMTTRLDSIHKIRRYHGPLLQTHGDADRLIPFAIGKKLFDAANEPKHFIPVPGGGHNDLPSDEFVHALDRFFDALPEPTRAAR